MTHEKRLSPLVLTGQTSLQMALGTSPQTLDLTKWFPKASLWFQLNRLPARRAPAATTAFERGHFA